MHAVLPIFRQEADTFWATPSGLEALEGFISQAVASCSRVSVVSDWEQALDIARRCGAEAVASAAKPGERLPLPGLEPARALLAAQHKGGTGFVLNFRNLDAPQLALQAVAEQGSEPWTCLASGRQPHDHPCQAFSMEQALALDIVHLFADEGALRPPGLPAGAVLTRPFSLDWRFLGVHDSTGGPFFTLAKDHPQGLAAKAVTDAHDLSARDAAVLIREDYALARLVLHPEAAAQLPPAASPYQGPSQLAGACLNPGRTEFSPLLYKDRAHNKLFLRVQAPPRSTSLRVLLLGSAGFMGYGIYPCAPGENTIAVNTFQVPAVYTHMVVCLCGWTGDAATPEFIRPFPGGDLWSIEPSGEVRNSENGEIMHGRQAFPPLVEIDGSFFVFRQGAGVGPQMPEPGEVSVALLPQGADLQVRSALDHLRRVVRLGQQTVGEGLLREQRAAPPPESCPEATPCPGAPAAEAGLTLTAKKVRLLNISIARAYLGNMPQEWAREKDGLDRAAKRMLVENHIHVLDQEGYAARKANLALGLSLLESAAPQQALAPLWDALRVAPDEPPIRRALERAAHRMGGLGVESRLSASRLDYLGGIDLGSGLAPRDLAAAGEGRLVFSDAKTQRLHVLDLASGRVQDLRTPRFSKTHAFCFDAARNSIVLCDHVGRRLALVSMEQDRTTFVDLPGLLQRESGSFSLIGVASGADGIRLVLDFPEEPHSVLQAISFEPHALVGAPLPAPTGQRFAGLAAGGGVLFAHAVEQYEAGSIHVVEGRAVRAIVGSSGFIMRLAAADAHVYAVYNRSGLAKFDLLGNVLFQADLSLLTGKEVGAVGLAVSPCGTRLHVADMTNSQIHAFGIEASR